MMDGGRKSWTLHGEHMSSKVVPLVTRRSVVYPLSGFQPYQERSKFSPLLQRQTQLAQQTSFAPLQSIVPPSQQTVPSVIRCNRTNSSSELVVVVARVPPMVFAHAVASAQVIGCEFRAYQCPFPPSSTFHCTAALCAPATVAAIPTTAAAVTPVILFNILWCPWSVSWMWLAPVSGARPTKPLDCGAFGGTCSELA